MSSAYTVQAGDTFASIARKRYGSEQYARLVASANPGAAEPLTAGTVLAVPPRAGAPVDKNTDARAEGENEVAVLIDGTRFRFWSGLTLTRSLDGMDTLEFDAPFEADAPGFREMFRPFSYKPLVVTVGGTPLFTGTLIGVTPNLGTPKMIAVSGYSRPGVLGDCTPPASAFPIEFNDQALPEIAAELAAPFGVPVRFDADGGAAFERVAVDPSDTVLAFLADLARQRALVVSSTPDGTLLFQQSAPAGAPVADLQQGVSPVLSVTPSFSPQQYFSHITGVEPVVMGLEGSQYTVKNPHLAGIVRPITFKAPDVEGGDIAQAVGAKAGRMYGNMAAYELRVNTWRAPTGALWAPNSTLKLHAPGAMVYDPFEFVIRSVRFEREPAEESAALDLVLPGSFSGQPPESLPWD